MVSLNSASTPPAREGVPSAAPGAGLSMLLATGWMVAGWVLLVGGYVCGALFLPQGSGLTAFGNMIQCFVPLLANTGLLLNATSPRWRQNWFWLLLALGCTLWMFGQV